MAIEKQAPRTSQPSPPLPPVRRRQSAQQRHWQPASPCRFNSQVKSPSWPEGAPNFKREYTRLPSGPLPARPVLAWGLVQPTALGYYYEAYEDAESAHLPLPTPPEEVIRYLRFDPWYATGDSQKRARDHAVGASFAAMIPHWRAVGEAKWPEKVRRIEAAASGAPDSSILVLSPEESERLIGEATERIASVQKAYAQHQRRRKQESEKKEGERPSEMVKRVNRVSKYSNPTKRCKQHANQDAKDAASGSLIRPKTVMVGGRPSLLVTLKVRFNPYSFDSSKGKPQKRSLDSGEDMRSRDGEDARPKRQKLMERNQDPLLETENGEHNEIGRPVKRQKVERPHQATPSAFAKLAYGQEEFDNDPDRATSWPMKLRITGNRITVINPPPAMNRHTKHKVTGSIKRSRELISESDSEAEEQSDDDIEDEEPLKAKNTKIAATPTFETKSTTEPPTGVYSGYKTYIRGPLANEKVALRAVGAKANTSDPAYKVWELVEYNPPTTRVLNQAERNRMLTIRFRLKQDHTTTMTVIWDEPSNWEDQLTLTKLVRRMAQYVRREAGKQKRQRMGYTKEATDWLVQWFDEDTHTDKRGEQGMIGQAAWKELTNAYNRQFPGEKRTWHAVMAKCDRYPEIRTARGLESK